MRGKSRAIAKAMKAKAYLEPICRALDNLVTRSISLSMVCHFRTDQIIRRRVWRKMSRVENMNLGIGYVLAVTFRLTQLK